MAPNVSVQTYKPRQQVLLKGKGKHRRRLGFSLHLLTEQGKIIGIMVTIALVIGLVFTQFFHGQTSSMQATIEQLRAKNMAMTNKNIALLVVRAQATSKTQIVALAKMKLKLFEPGQGQVRRM